jgi:hypothetical protein
MLYFCSIILYMNFLCWTTVCNLTFLVHTLVKQCFLVPAPRLPASKNGKKKKIDLKMQLISNFIFDSFYYNHQAKIKFDISTQHAPFVFLSYSHFCFHCWFFLRKSTAHYYAKAWQWFNIPTEYLTNLEW